MMMTETGGTMNCSLRGKNGEKGCGQWMPGNWERQSKKYFGYVAPMTLINETYLMTLMINEQIESGHDVASIARLHNQGNAGPCVRGVNSAGVKYDSCAYQNKVLSYYDN